MNEERNWGAEPWRAPSLEEGDSLIFDECGRVLDNTCYRSHYFRMVKNGNLNFIIVKHGGGQERHQVGYSNRLGQALVKLDSDARYFMLHTLYRAIKDAKHAASMETAREYTQAFVDGRLRKRKLPARHRTRVWIEGVTDSLVKVAT